MPFDINSFVTVLESVLTARHLGQILTQCGTLWLFYIMQPHPCFVHSLSLFPLHSLLKGFMLAIISCPDYFSHAFALMLAMRILLVNLVEGLWWQSSTGFELDLW